MKAMPEVNDEASPAFVECVLAVLEERVEFAWLT
jgi:hypothetical protein